MKMNSSPTVTVVLPTYNRARVIGETIDSILAQQFHDFELLVVADGCTDETDAVVTAYGDPRIRIVHQPNSGGPAKPRNTGVQQARGRYIAFCDDDDLWVPEKLQKQIAWMESTPDIALSYTSGVTFGEGDYFAKRTIKRGPRGDHFRRLLYGNFVPNSSVVVRKSVLDVVGPFNVDTRLHGVEDYEMWLRISYRYRLACLDEPLIRYRIHGTTLGANRTRATLKTLHVVRNLERNTSIRAPRALPIAWQWFKYAAYRMMRR